MNSLPSSFSIIFSVSSCVYFISVAAVFVFLTARRVESRRWN